MLRRAGNYYFCSVSIGGKMSIKVKPVICFAALRMSKFSSSGNWNEEKKKERCIKSSSTKFKVKKT